MGYQLALIVLLGFCQSRCATVGASGIASQLISASASGAPNSDKDFDSVVDLLDECDATPENVAVDKLGCPLEDTDQDGVADGRDQCLMTPTGEDVFPNGCMNHSYQCHATFKIIDGEPSAADPYRVTAQYENEAKSDAELRCDEDVEKSLQKCLSERGDESEPQCVLEQKTLVKVEVERGLPETCTALSCLSPLGGDDSLTAEGDDRNNAVRHKPREGDSPPAAMLSVLNDVGVTPPANSVYIRKLFPVAQVLQQLSRQSQFVPLGDQGRVVLNDFVAQSTAFLSLANDHYAKGQEGTGDAYMHLSALMAQSAIKILSPDFATALISSVGPAAVVRDFYEAGTGRSIVNGSKLSTVDRSVALVSIATGGVDSTLFKKMQTSDRIASLGGMLREAAAKSGHSTDELDPVVRTAEEMFQSIDTIRTRVTEEGGDRFKNVSSYMSSEAIKSRLEKLGQDATKFIGR